MADGFPLLVVLGGAALFVVFVLIIVPVCRSGRHRKWCYLDLVLYELAWFLLLDQLFALLGAPPAWRYGVDGVLFALMAATLVLLYRHRLDPDPDDI